MIFLKWNKRIRILLLALLFIGAMHISGTATCRTDLYLLPYCAIERLISPSTFIDIPAALPAPMRLLLLAYVAIIIPATLLMVSSNFALVWRRRFIEVHLPRGVPWGDRFLPYTVAMRDP